MWAEQVGEKSNPVKNRIEHGAVKKFAEAIGDLNPVYLDEDFAKTTPHGGIIAPPTFPRTLDYGVIEGLHLPLEGLIHGEQSYHYKRPLYVGEIVYCNEELLEVVEKQGKQGPMVMLKMKQTCRSEKGEEIFLSERLTIITSKVREMNYSGD